MRRSWHVTMAWDLAGDPRREGTYSTTVGGENEAEARLNAATEMADEQLIEDEALAKWREAHQPSAQKGALSSHAVQDRIDPLKAGAVPPGENIPAGCLARGAMPKWA